jgi:hypothetical protein
MSEGTEIGFFLESFFETVVRSPWVVVFNLVLVGILFIVAEAVGRRSRQADKLSFAQAAALVPEGMPSPTTASCSLRSSLYCLFSGFDKRRVVLVVWYTMHCAVSATGRFTREERTHPGCAATLLLR